MQQNKSKNKKYIFKKFLIVFLNLLILFASGYAISKIILLNSIETEIRYMLIGAFILLDLVFAIRGIFIVKNINKGVNKKRIPYIILSLIYIIILLVLGLVISFFYSKLGSLNKDNVSYTTYLVVRSDDKANDINDIKKYTIGMIDDKNLPDGYTISKNIINEYKLEDDNTIEKFSDYNSIISKLYKKEIQAAFLPSNYVETLSSQGYENIGSETKVIYKKTMSFKKTKLNSHVKSNGGDLTKPFSILLMGVDTTEEVLNPKEAAHGDTLILVTFDPKTLNTTMLSIPRDSYVPIACWKNKAKNKITHAAMYGDKCTISTIEEFLDVKIDYYAKINFKGFTKLVDAVGGVKINVEKSLCTDNSNREKVVCVNPGEQILDGEHALVYARNRKQLVDGDFGRNKHQQEVVLAIIDKIKEIRDVSKFNQILNTISNSMDTNLTPSQMLSFYNVLKDMISTNSSSNKAKLINVEQLKIVGTNQMIFDERANMKLWNFIPNPLSVKDDTNAMKSNLGLIPHKEITTFKFSLAHPYEKEVIGSGPYRSVSGYSLLPSFIGLSKGAAKTRAQQYGINLSFTGGNGNVVSQNYPEGKRIDLISGNVVLTLSKTADDLEENTKDKNKDNKDIEKNNKDKTKEEEKDNANNNSSNSTTSSNHSTVAP